MSTRRKTSEKDPTRITTRRKDPPRARKDTETTSLVLERKENYSPTMVEAANSFEDGYLKRATTAGLRIMVLPKVDMFNPNALRERIGFYLQVYAEANLKPTMSGLAMALGVDRRRLWEIRTGNHRDPNGIWHHLPQESVDLIIQSYDLLEQLHEGYMANGQINPVTGIFMAKNFYGYRDQTEHVVTADSGEHRELNAEELSSRYLEDSEDEPIEIE